MNFVTWSIRNPVPVIMMFVALLVGGVWGFRKLPVQDQPDISVAVCRRQRRLRGHAAIADGDRGHAQGRGCDLDTRSASSTSAPPSAPAARRPSSSSTSRPTCRRPWTTCATRCRASARTCRWTPPNRTSRGPRSPATPCSRSRSAPDRLTDTELSWFVDLNVMRFDQRRRGRRPGDPHRRRVARSAGRPGPGSHGGAGRDRRRRVVASWCARRWSCRAARCASARRNRACARWAPSASIQQLAALPISLGDGRSTRLDSIADVRDQAAEVRQVALLDGKPVIGFRVMRAWGEGAVEVADGTRKAVEELQPAVSADQDHRDQQHPGQGSPRRVSATR